MASSLLSSSSSFLHVPRKLLVHGHCPSQTTLWFSRKQSSLCVRAATLPQGVISLLNVLLSLYPIRDWNFRFYLSTFFLCWEDDSAKEGTQIQTSVSGIYIHSWDMELQSLYDWSHRILHCWAGEFQWLSNICRQDWLKTELSFSFFFSSRLWTKEYFSWLVLMLEKGLIFLSDSDLLLRLPIWS